MIEYPDLPVSRHRKEIIAALEEHQIVVVVGDTGSGKTTQLPKMGLEYLHSLKEKETTEEKEEKKENQGKKRSDRAKNPLAKQGRVGCTQPRRIAAASVCKRVAEELKVEQGKEVGYQVRFEDKSSEETQLKFMTDGILLAETQGDPQLKQYGVIIIDEAHERSLNIDFLLGYLKRLLKKRKELRVIISSATLDAGAFSEFFQNAPVIEVEGRTFPVETHYLPAREELDLTQHVLQACEWVRQLDREGDILIFLPGEREIRECTETLEGKFWRNTEVLPLFARLGLTEQQRVFRTLKGTQRIVLATNVAETSLTIPGIVYVIDSGMARVSRWNPSRQVQRLQIEKISQASARQRKGRCGRVREGVCVRLYEEEDHEERSEFTDPEIRRSSLAGVILRMKSLRLPEIDQFPFLDPPSTKHINEGYRTLREIGALNEENHLLKAGRQLSRLPIEPRLGKMLLEAEQRNCLSEVLVIVSGLSIMDPKERPQEKQQQADQAHAKWKHENSDFLSLLLLWHDLNQWKTGRKWQRNQLRKFCKKHFLNFRRVLEWDNLHNELHQLSRSVFKQKIEMLAEEINQWAHEDAIHCSILAGVPKQIGVYEREKRSFKGAQGREFSIFPGSGLFSKKKHDWILAYEMVDTSKLWARRNAVLNPEWVEEVAPHLCRKRWHSPYWDQQQGAVYAKEVLTCANLTLIEGRRVHFGRIQPKAARQVFIAEALLGGGIRAKLPLLQHIEKLKKDVLEWEKKLRRVNGIWAEDQLAEWFNQQLPEQCHTAKAFIQWTKQCKKRPTLSNVSHEDLDAFDTASFPDSLTWKTFSFPLHYQSAPGEIDDGITVEIHVDDLAVFPTHLVEWGVHGDLEERCYLLIRSLPKTQRIACNPARETAANFAEQWRGKKPVNDFYSELSQFLTEVAKQAITPAMLDSSRLPENLCMNLWIVDDNHKELAFGKNINEVKSQLATLMKARFEKQTSSEWNISKMTGFDCKPLPVSMQKPQGTAYPALIDEGKSVGVKAFANPHEAKYKHAKGCVRLFLLQHADHAKYVIKNLPLSFETKLSLPVLGETGIDQTAILHWSIQRAMATNAAKLPRDKASFQKQAQDARGTLYQQAEQVCGFLDSIIAAQRALKSSIKTYSNNSNLEEIAEDLEEQMAWLLRKNYVKQLDGWNLEHYVIWFEGMQQRTQRLSNQPLIKDLEKMDQLLELWLPWYDYWQKNTDDFSVLEAGYALQNLRTQTFAPNLPLQEKTSEKQVENKLEALGIQRQREHE